VRFVDLESFDSNRQDILSSETWANMSALYVCPFINNLHQICAWRQSCIQASSNIQMIIGITGSLLLKSFITKTRWVSAREGDRLNYHPLPCDRLNWYTPLNQWEDRKFTWSIIIYNINWLSRGSIS
jgi:hypothetical protein